MIIYQITNNVNQKKYIGQTVQTLDIRKESHLQESRKTKPRRTISCAIKKYGPENFTFKQLCECKTQDEFDETEKKLIIKYNTLSPNGMQTAETFFINYQNKNKKNFVKRLVKVRKKVLLNLKKV